MRPGMPLIVWRAGKVVEISPAEEGEAEDNAAKAREEAARAAARRDSNGPPTP